jgi:hypothetical protein
MHTWQPLAEPALSRAQPACGAAAPTEHAAEEALRRARLKNAHLANRWVKGAGPQHTSG